MFYAILDNIYIVSSVVSIILHLLLIMIAYRFLYKRRWPKWN